MDCAMTSSPTRSTKLSNFRVSSFTNPVAPSAFAEDSLGAFCGGVTVAEEATASATGAAAWGAESWDVASSGFVGVGKDGGD